MTFDQMCEIEPRLAVLYNEWIPAIVAKGGGFWPCWVEIKRRMSALVGWSAENGRLSSSQCYDVAYRTCFARFNELHPPE